MKISKRVIALVLTVLMMLAAVPISASAEAQVEIKDLTATVKNAEADTYVYFEYVVKTELSLVDAQVDVIYPANSLEFIDQRYEGVAFPNIAGVNNLQYHNNVEGDSGRFSMTFSDIDHENIKGFDEGATLVYAVFKVIEAGDVEIKVNEPIVSGRNTNIADDELNAIDDENGRDSIKCVVRNDLLEVFDVIFPEEEGLVFAGNEYVLEGNDYSFIIEAEEGYDTSKMVVKVNGKTVTADENGIYTATKIDAEPEITVEGVEKIKFPVTIPTGEGFTVTGEKTATYGEDYTFTVEIAEGYSGNAMTVKANGTALTPNSSGEYVVQNVMENITITVEGVAKAQIPVTLPTGDGFTVNGAATVTYGEDYTFTVTVAEGYNADEMTVTVNGKTVTPDENGVYTIEGVTAAPTIAVSGIVAKPPYKLGNVDHTKENDVDTINATDATLVLQYFAKIITDETTNITFDKELADVSGDTEVNATDATLILQYFAKIITSFPAEAAQA